MERTLSLIKPDGVKKGLIGELIRRFEKNGLKPVALKMIHLSKKKAEGFYEVHKERPFFGELCEYMTSGPVVVQVLEGANAVARNREIMGATNPAQAEEGTVRKAHGVDVQANSVHGSDSPENAAIEVAFFFSGTEIVG